jgi:hypothetical protein
MIDFYFKKVLIIKNKYVFIKTIKGYNNKKIEFRLMKYIFPTCFKET